MVTLIMLPRRSLDSRLRRNDGWVGLFEASHFASQGSSALVRGRDKASVA